MYGPCSIGVVGIVQHMHLLYNTETTDSPSNAKSTSPSIDWARHLSERECGSDFGEEKQARLENLSTGRRLTPSR